jgi:hypothetical protein
VNPKGLTTGVIRLHAFNHLEVLPGATRKGTRARLDHVGTLDEKVRRAAKALDELAAA